MSDNDKLLLALHALVKEFERVCAENCMQPERHPAYRAATELIERS